MDADRLIRKIADSAEGVPVRGGIAVGFDATGAVHDDRTLGQVAGEFLASGSIAPLPMIQIRRPDGSHEWVRARDVRRAGQ